MAADPRVMTASMHTVARLGRAREENEDSAAIRPEHGRFAVADGASTSARPEVWSRLLVEAFVNGAADPLQPATLRSLRDRWWAEVDRPGLPWFAQAKLQSGADSSFLGLAVDEADLRWTATCVGDSCVFQIRDGRAHSVGPVERSNDFGRFAELISSRHAVAPQPTVLTGSYRPGDLFVLATDAFAQFLLRTEECYGHVPSLGWVTQTASRFLRMVAAYRHHGCLANDDTTICVVRT